MKIYTDEEAFLIASMDRVLSVVQDAFNFNNRPEELPLLIQEVKAVCDKMDIKKQRDELLEYVQICKDELELQRLFDVTPPSYIRFRIGGVLMNLKKTQEK